MAETTFVFYTVAYQGLNGTGAVNTVNGLNPNAQGNVQLPPPSTDYSVTLLASGWSNGVQTVQNAAFLASGYNYLVGPAAASRNAYGEAGIYTDDDVTVDGSMTFHCEDTPDTDLTVTVIRVVAT